MYRNENENYDITDLVVAWDNIPLTCGAIGSYVFTASKESYVATPKPSQVGLEKDRGSTRRICP